MKQSKKIICGLSVLCVALIIVVVVLLVKIFTPQASDPREQQMFRASNGGGQTVDGQIQTPEAQTPGGEVQAPAVQAPGGDSQNSPSNLSGQNQDQSQGTQDIGREAAKSAALTHAGLSETQVVGMKVEQDWDDGRLEYEVEFKSGGMEYDYTIDGVTGTVLSFEKEVDD
ncbi:MAG: PepSY domain-containing protein [Butyrivibrio sp.]|nr:PepSY domain-containing protein [Acetatifactor muris]MCM1560029.1 PepSY domain-containing protein [Butyrivibrio sp.]